MDTNSSFNENDELIDCCKSNITLIVGDIIIGKGTLYIADSNLYWKNDNQVITMNYEAMSDFIICNHPEIQGKSCLLISIDLNYNTPDVDEVDRNEDEEEENISTLLLVPDSPECLDEIYEMLTGVQPTEIVEESDQESDQESDLESNLTESESEEHEDSDNNSHITSSSTSTLEDQEAGSIDVSNQYHELDTKNGEKENQDEEVLINERKRKFEDLPEQEEKPTKIRKLWNLIYPFQKVTSFNTSISENEPNISIDEAIAGKKNSLELDTAVCENNSDSVKAEEKNSKNNSEADGENEDTSTNETSQQFCKIM